MDETPRLSKKELKEQKKLLKLAQELEGKKQNTIKWIVISVASLLFLGFFIFLLSKGKESTTTADVKIADTDWTRGEKNAKVTLVEFSDLQCPACKRYEPWVQQLTKDYPKDLKLIYKHFPLSSIHKNALTAARAAESAGKQGKFWEMHDLLFAKQDEWEGLNDPSDMFTSYTKMLKLNIDTFKKDLDDKEIANKISADEAEGTDLGVNSTPTFFLNNVQNITSYKKIDNPARLEEFKKIIQEALKK